MDILSIPIQVTAMDNRDLICVILGLSMSILKICICSARHWMENPETGEMIVVGHLGLPEFLFSPDMYFSGGLWICKSYLNLVNIYTTYISTSIHTFTFPELDQILLNFRAIINMHGASESFITNYPDISPMFTRAHFELIYLHIEWRTTGEDLVNVYRLIEERLQIPVETVNIHLNIYER